MKRIFLAFSIMAAISCHKDKVIGFVDARVSMKSVCDTTPIIVVVGPGQSLEENKTYASDITIPSGYAMAFKGLATRSGAFVDWTELPPFNEKKPNGLPTSTSELHYNEATMIPSFIKTVHEATGRRVFVVKYVSGGTLQGCKLLDTLNQKSANWGPQGQSCTVVANGTDQPLFKRWTQTIDSFLKRSNFTRADVNEVIYDLGYSDAVKINATTPAGLKKYSYDDLYDLVTRVHDFLPNAHINLIEVARADNLYSNGFISARSNQDSITKVLPYCTIIDTSLKHYPVSWTVDGLHPNNIGFDTLGARVGRKLCEKY